MPKIDGIAELRCEAVRLSIDDKAMHCVRLTFRMPTGETLCMHMPVSACAIFALEFELAHAKAMRAEFIEEGTSEATLAEIDALIAAIESRTLEEMAKAMDKIANELATPDRREGLH